MTRVNAARLADAIASLGAIGAVGTGVSRPAFSAPDRRARAWVAERMRAAALDVRVDAAGNVIGRREGSEALGAIATGSHIDTVPEAGRYDGAYGVVAGIEVARSLAEAGVILRHPLEVIAFADEEGARYAGGLFGSRAMAGLTDDALIESARRGDPSWEEDVRAAGGDLDAVARGAARREPGAIAAYVELHVEQGPVLAREGVAIGVVTGVTGRIVLDARVTGVPNHAGTTPMDMRADALVAAANLVLAVEAVAARDALCRTATTGVISVLPGAVNVVPGSAALAIELRDVDMTRLAAAAAALRTRADRIAHESRVTIDLEARTTVQAAPAEALVRDAVARAAQALGLSTREMPSGAGHDAQAIARIAPMGMIFVPSAEGVSHSTSEYTAPEDCVNGANVLLGTLLDLDRTAPPR